MATTINGVNCAVTRKGTGYIECVQELGTPIGVIKTPVNWSLDIDTETFDSLAYIQTEIQKGNFVPFIGGFNFTDNSAEAVFQESQTGNKSKVRDGKPEFMFDYQNGYCWNKAAFSHNSRNCGIIIVWDNNVFGFHVSSDGTKLKALRANYFNVGTFKNNDGANNLTTPISIQLRDANAYNAEMALVEPLTYDYEDINGIIDVNIAIPNPPADTDTTIDVQITASCNSLLYLSVFTADTLEITGKTVSLVSYNATTNLYTITVAEAFTSGDTYTVSVGDGTYASAVIEDQPYAGSSVQQVVA